MRRRAKVVVGIVLLASTGLAVWDRARGRTVDDVMRRTEQVFLVRADLAGCGEPTHSTVAYYERHKTHYGVKLPSVEKLIGGLEREANRRMGGVFFERVRFSVTRDADVISFPSGGDGCYDDLFVPVIVRFDIGRGFELALPSAVRITQRASFDRIVPFVGPELTGFYRDDIVPPKRYRGRVDQDGNVPPMLDRPE